MSCKSCKFYFSECDTPNCRRFPPVWDPNLLFGAFPAVHEQDWCGEFCLNVAVQDEMTKLLRGVGDRSLPKT